MHELPESAEWGEWGEWGDVVGDVASRIRRGRRQSSLLLVPTSLRMSFADGSMGVIEAGSGPAVHLCGPGWEFVPLLVRGPWPRVGRLEVIRRTLSQAGGGRCY